MLIKSICNAGQGCSRNPCGTNAICQETLGGRPVCSCPPGHSGNPLSYCRRGECADHIECGLSQACQNGVCINPCVGKCGTNAHCEVLNHVAQCSCPARYRGDPFSYCTPIDPGEITSRSFSHGQTQSLKRFVSAHINNFIHKSSKQVTTLTQRRETHS